MNAFENVSNLSLAILAGGISGGVASALITSLLWRMQRRNELARNFLIEMVELFALKEAWILEGPDYKDKRLSDLRALPTSHQSEGHWLRNVEIRAVLDRAPWNYPDNPYYGFLRGRRAWIVRDLVQDEPDSYLGAYAREDHDPHPAIVSSHGLHGIRNWIERLALANQSGMLPRQGVDVFYDIVSIAGEDRFGIFRPPLSDRAKSFLRSHRSRPSDEFSMWSPKAIDH